MKPEEDYLDVLQNIEAVVVETWKQYPEMKDYAVLRAYEVAIEHYKAVARGGTPKPVHLTGADLQVYAAVHAVCESRLRRGAEGDGPVPGDDLEVPAMPVEDLLTCLRRLRKSVERWNRSGGQRGYLEFVSQFLS